eukprot:224927-Pleurochrysis_carterae.AAC.2
MSTDLNVTAPLLQFEAAKEQPCRFRRDNLTAGQTHMLQSARMRMKILFVDHAEDPPITLKEKCCLRQCGSKRDVVAKRDGPTCQKKVRVRELVPSACVMLAHAVGQHAWVANQECSQS